MKFNQFIDSLDWKRLVIVVLAVLLLLSVVREMVFWHFVHEFKQTYNNFTNQFDHDQQMIEQKIAEGETQQAALDLQMDALEKIMDEKVNQTFDQVMDFQKNTANTIAQGDEKIQRDFAEFPEKMRKEGDAFVEQTIKSFDQEKNTNETKRHQDFIKQDQAERAQMAAFQNAQKKDDKAKWEIARKHFFEETGETLPSYEEFMKSKVKTD